MAPPSTNTPLKVLGRYALHEVIASGGMATVHFGRLQGPVGFARTVAIKRLHERLAQDPEFTSMFLDEARLAARIRHPNVIPTLDVVAMENELFLVMEYVQGESLSRLYSQEREKGTQIAIPMLATLIAGALHGLHAAHEAKSEGGTQLGLIHRDVSPQNILVGVDGVARVLDFGVAKAAGRAATTRDGQLKGKLSYMAPEQLGGAAITRAIDIYAAGVVLWEGLAGRRLYKADSEAELVTMVLQSNIPPPSKLAGKGISISPELDAIVLKAVAKAPEQRFATAREMARALEKLIPPIPASDIGEWVEQAAGTALAARSHAISIIERSSTSDVNTAIAGSAHTPSSEGGRLLNAQPTATEVPSPPSSSQPAGAPPREPETSSLSAASAIALPIHGPQGKRLYLLVAAAAIVGLVLVVGTIISFRSTSPSPTTGGTDSTGSTTGAPTISQQPPPSPSPSPPNTVPPPEESAAAVVAPTPTPAASPPKKPTIGVATTTTGARPPTTAVQTARPPPPPAPNCDPPYVIDANGTRRYKRECAR